MNVGSINYLELNDKLILIPFPNFKHKEKYKFSFHDPTPTIKIVGTKALEFYLFKI